MKSKMKKFPKTPFKLDCGDKPEVRQWLKGNGCVWIHSGCLSENLLDKRYLIIGSDRLVSYAHSAEALTYQEFVNFNPFKKKSKFEERVEALEERIASVGFTDKVECVVDAPKPVNVGRYKPEKYDRYYFIDGAGYVESTGNSNFSIDKYNISTGNCFRTKEEAEQALLRQQALVRVNDRIDELNNGWVDDYKNNRDKFYIAMTSTLNMYPDVYRSWNVASIFNTAKSYNVLEAVISEMAEDIKLAAGWN